MSSKEGRQSWPFAHYYQEEEFSPIPAPHREKHTMSAASLEDYILTTKFSDAQVALLQEAVQLGHPIEVRGLYVGHLEYLIQSMDLKEVTRAVREPRRNKKYNRYRPEVIKLKHKTSSNGMRVWVIPFPSREYVDQYAQLTRALVETFAPVGAKLALSCWHYPQCEASLAVWSGLEAVNLHLLDGDVVVLGYVQELTHLLERYDFKPTLKAPVTFGADGIYDIIVLQHISTGRRLLLLGVRHSYWGSASGLIVRQLAEAGARHIIYIAKGGCLSTPEHVHQAFCPSGYYRLEEVDYEGKWLWRNHRVPSILDDSELSPIFDDIRAGIHLTVPTVLGETIRQTHDFSRLRPSSIDNEAGYMAAELEWFNRNRADDDRCSLTCMYFITDYLRSDEDQDKEGLYDLASLEPEVKIQLHSFLATASTRLSYVVGRIGAVKPNPAAFPHDERPAPPFDAVEALVEYGDYRGAIGLRLGSTSFADASPRVQLEVGIIEQKYGLLVDARRHLNLVKKFLWQNFPPDYQVHFRVLDVKLAAQEGHFQVIVDQFDDLLSDIRSSDHNQFAPALLHRKALAAAISGDPEECLACLNESAEMTVSLKQMHAMNTCTYNKTITQFFRGVPHGIDDPLTTIIEIQRRYLVEHTEREFWQANRLKSCVHSMFAEGAMLLAKGDVRAYRPLTVANVLAARISCGPQAEGFAELLWIIPEGSTRDTVRAAMAIDDRRRRWFHERYPFYGLFFNESQEALQFLFHPTEETWEVLRRVIDRQ